MTGQTAVASAGATDLTEYLATLRRRWIWVVVVAVIAALVAAWLLSTRPEATSRFNATTTVSPALTQTANQARVEAEAEFVRSDRVATLASDALGQMNETFFEILSAVSVNVPEDSGLIEIDFSSDSAADAQLASQAFAEAYLATRQATIESENQALIDRLTAEVNTVSQELLDATSLAVTTDEESVERANALAVSSVLQTQLSRLRTERSLAIVADLPAGDIVRSAEVVENRSTELPAVPLVAAALALGMLVGVLLAFLIDRIDPRILSDLDAERTAGALSLGLVPHTHLVMDPDEVGPAFSQAATSISSIARTAGTNAVLVAPLSRRTHPSAVLPNLVSAHLVAGRPTTVLAIDTLDRGMNELESNDLTVIPRLPVDAQPEDIIDRLEADELLFASSNAFLTRPEAVEAASAARFLVLVVQIGSTRRADVRAAVEMAANTHIKYLRVVVERRPNALRRLLRNG